MYINTTACTDPGRRAEHQQLGHLRLIRLRDELIGAKLIEQQRATGHAQNAGLEFPASPAWLALFWLGLSPANFWAQTIQFPRVAHARSSIVPPAWDLVVLLVCKYRE